MPFHMTSYVTLLSLVLRGGAFRARRLRGLIGRLVRGLFAKRPGDSRVAYWHSYFRELKYPAITSGKYSSATMKII